MCCTRVRYHSHLGSRHSRALSLKMYLKHPFRAHMLSPCNGLEDTTVLRVRCARARAQGLLSRALDVTLRSGRGLAQHPLETVKCTALYSRMTRVSSKVRRIKLVSVTSHHEPSIRRPPARRTIHKIHSVSSPLAVQYTCKLSLWGRRHPAASHTHCGSSPCSSHMIVV